MPPMLVPPKGLLVIASCLIFACVINLSYICLTSELVPIASKLVINTVVIIIFSALLLKLRIENPLSGKKNKTVSGM